MTVEEEQSHLFDGKLRKYEDRLVEILLDIAKSKRTTPKMSTIASYLLIHGNLTQKELKKLTGLSMGTISTYLSVMIGTGNFRKQRIPGTHTFIYSFSGELEVLTTRAIEIALSSLGSLESFLKNKREVLKKLIEQSKEGAEHLSQRIEDLLESFEIYKKIFPPNGTSAEGIQKQSSIKPFKLLKSEQKEVKEIQFDPEVYLVEDDIINQILASPMFSTRDPMFIKILGYFITRKYLTQETIKRITGLSSGKISEEVNRFLEDDLIHKAEVSSKGKITYYADSLILLKFSRHIINKMAKWEKELENMKLDLENNMSELEILDGYAQIYKICDYTLDVTLKYLEYIKRMDNLVEL